MEEKKGKTLKVVDEESYTNFMKDYEHNFNSFKIHTKNYNVKLVWRIRDEIPALPNGLKIFDCVDSGISLFPSLPVSLEKLYCMGNKLTHLPPNLPPNLIVLDCRDNIIYSLPTFLPKSLKMLKCDNNRLDSLPPLPDSLEILTATENQIVEFPPIPEGIETLQISHQYIDNDPFNYWEETEINDEEEKRLQDERMARGIPKNLEEKKGISSIEEIPSGSYINKCISDTQIDLYGDTLKEGDDIIIFVLNGKLFCYTLSDLENTWKYGVKLFYWDEGKADINNPVYQVPIIGYIDKRSKELVGDYNTILLNNKAEVPLGSREASYNAISAMHGASDLVYRGVPINKAKFIGENKIEMIE